MSPEAMQTPLAQEPQVEANSALTTPIPEVIARPSVIRMEDVVEAVVADKMPKPGLLDAEVDRQFTEQFVNAQAMAGMRGTSLDRDVYKAEHQTEVKTKVYEKAGEEAKGEVTVPESEEKIRQEYLDEAVEETARVLGGEKDERIASFVEERVGSDLDEKARKEVRRQRRAFVDENREIVEGHIRQFLTDELAGFDREGEWENIKQDVMRHQKAIFGKTAEEDLIRAKARTRIEKRRNLLDKVTEDQIHAEMKVVLQDRYRPKMEQQLQTRRNEAYVAKAKEMVKELVETGGVKLEPDQVPVTAEVTGGTAAGASVKAAESATSAGIPEREDSESATSAGTLERENEKIGRIRQLLDKVKERMRILGKPEPRVHRYEESGDRNHLAKEIYNAKNKGRTLKDNIEEAVDVKEREKIEDENNIAKVVESDASSGSFIAGGDENANLIGVEKVNLMINVELSDGIKTFIHLNAEHATRIRETFALAVTQAQEGEEFYMQFKLQNGQTVFVPVSDLLPEYRKLAEDLGYERAYSEESLRQLVSKMDKEMRSKQEEQKEGSRPLWTAPDASPTTEKVPLWTAPGSETVKEKTPLWTAPAVSESTPAEEAALSEEDEEPVVQPGPVSVQAEAVAEEVVSSDGMPLEQARDRLQYLRDLSKQKLVPGEVQARGWTAEEGKEADRLIKAIKAAEANSENVIRITSEDVEAAAPVVEEPAEAAVSSIEVAKAAWEGVDKTDQNALLEFAKTHAPDSVHAVRTMISRGGDAKDIAEWIELTSLSSPESTDEGLSSTAAGMI